MITADAAAHLRKVYEREAHPRHSSSPHPASHSIPIRKGGKLTASVSRAQTCKRAIDDLAHGRVCPAVTPSPAGHLRGPSAFLPTIGHSKPPSRSQRQRRPGRRMPRKRTMEPQAPLHLIEPLNPYLPPTALRDTPGYIARLLEVYRPRPPSRHRAFPSPFKSLDNISTGHVRRNSGRSQAPMSPMDALASTALNNSPTFGHHHRRPSQTVAPPQFPSQRSPSHTNSSGFHVESAYHDYGERPSKRARSEALSSPFPPQAHPRPATSHRQTAGVRQNVEDGFNSATRKRQLSQTERDILDFMESLQSRRHEGRADPWLQESPLPAPLVEQLTAHANNGGNYAPPEGQVPAAASSVAPDPVAAIHPADRGVTVMHARLEPPTHATIMEEMEGIVKRPSISAVQTQTPPEEKEATPASTLADTPTAALPSFKPTCGGKGTAAKAKAVGKKQTAKATGEPDGEQAVDATPQLQSPQSLPHEPSDPRVGYSLGVSAILTLPSADIPPRPRSVQSLALPDPVSPVLRGTEERSASVPPSTPMVIYAGTTQPAPATKRPGRPRKLKQNTICASCHFSPNSLAGEPESWLQCNGCKSWYHFACAGFRNEREVRDIDKFYCKQCTPKYGKTTRVRKSARAHNSVDYAKLTEGIVQTSDETVEHHYIKPIKNGDIDFTPETFPRMPPELVTSDYFERCRALTEPVVIPAAWNPRPSFIGSDDGVDLAAPDNDEDHDMPAAVDHPELLTERVEDLGQDQLGMVIPQGLTVRRVAELYGLHEKLEVIDVKSQEGEDKRWNLAKWADYYEDKSDDKPVRNVISLEVSRTRLGHLIRRPQVVRDLDLADSVWIEKGHPPKVQFYILMSVADCFTDFHIDFGGSSVYYHIVKGSKTFFFIPPTTANLKHYENWCKSQAQNYCWLGNQTKECYRVDLSEGDTMLIPSGWIHAVWTPTDSLVVGGNFLTRLNYTNQIKVLEIEKSTKVPLKFRYPYFQKVMWFAVLQYLAQDPLPATVEALLQEGGQFHRDLPIYQDYNRFGHNSHPGVENYNARYYPQAEIDGLPDLLSYIFRTVMIMLGRVEGVTVEQQNAVTKSIPKDPVEHGNPLVNARKFAMWVAWKRGNEQIPEWAHTEAVLPERPESDDKTKKLSAAALKKLERAKHIELYHSINADKLSQRSSAHASRGESPGTTPTSVMGNGVKVPYASPKNSVLGPKRSACDACRKRRVGCKHKEAVRDASIVNGQRQFEFVAPNAKPPPLDKEGSFDMTAIDPALEEFSDAQPISSIEPPPLSAPPLPPYSQPAPGFDLAPPDMAPLFDQADQWNATPSRPAPPAILTTPLSANASRNKACANCRKSKRKCLHDENGNLDPAKVAESKQPRATAKKRPSDGSSSTASAKKIKTEQLAMPLYAPDEAAIHVNSNIAPELYNLPAPSASLPAPVAPMAPMLAPSTEQPQAHAPSQSDPAASVSSFRQALLGIDLSETSPLQHHEAAHVDGYTNQSAGGAPLSAFDSFSAPFGQEQQQHDSSDDYSEAGFHRSSQPPLGQDGQAPATNGFGDGDHQHTKGAIPLDPSLEAVAAQAMSAASASHNVLGADA